MTVEHRERGDDGHEVLVCRGCCCGTIRKHREVDHDGQLALLRAAAAASPVPCTVRVVGCLSACEVSNVVVVRPSARQRRGGEPVVWFGLVNGPGAVTDLARWLADGGPGHAPMPDALAMHLTRAPRASRTG